MKFNDSEVCEYHVLKELKILVVDDHLDTVELFTIILSSQGADVVTASSVKQALAVLEHQPIDILISDYRLPDGNGYSLIEKVQSQGLDTQSIMITGSDAFEEQEKALQQGFVFYLSKPVEPDYLIEVITNLKK